jgi:hypothetical protein
MLTITRRADGSWQASFSFKDGVQLPRNEELLIQHSFTPEAQILALDRGVAHPLADSEGKFYDLEKPVSVGFKSLLVAGPMEFNRGPDRAAKPLLR